MTFIRTVVICWAATLALLIGGTLLADWVVQRRWGKKWDPDAYERAALEDLYARPSYERDDA